MLTEACGTNAFLAALFLFLIVVGCIVAVTPATEHPAPSAERTSK